MEHDLKVPAKRQLSGPKRVAAKQELRTVRAAPYRTKLLADPKLDMATVKKNNLTVVQTLQVLRGARKEVCMVASAVRN